MRDVLYIVVACALVCAAIVGLARRSRPRLLRRRLRPPALHVMRTFWIIYAVVAFTAAVTMGYIAVRPPFPVYVDPCDRDPMPKDCG